MEAGADYIYSLLLGYDRTQDALLGAAAQVELSADDGYMLDEAKTDVKTNEDGSTKSVSETYFKDNFYLYGDGEDWVLRSYRDLKIVFTPYVDGIAGTPEDSFSHELLEANPKYEKEYAADHSDYTPLKTAADAWSHRTDIHWHQTASWATGQHFNPFKAGGVISMASPLKDLEAFHRTDFTALELAQDASDLENASYWLLKNQNLQEDLVKALPALQEAFAAIPEGEAPTSNRAFFDASQPVVALLDQMQSEDKDVIAEDVTAFLAWSSDINLNTRKSVGLWVVLLLGLLSILLFFYYREVAKVEFAKQRKYGGPWDENH